MPTPVKALSVISGFEKQFPVFFFLFNIFQFELGMKQILSKILIKILSYFGFFVTLLIVWPILTILSFFGLRKLLFLVEIPKTTVWEMATVLLLVGLNLLIAVVGPIIFICMNTMGFLTKIYLKYKFGIDIDCGF